MENLANKVEEILKLTSKILKQAFLGERPDKWSDNYLDTSGEKESFDNYKIKFKDTKLTKFS